MRTLQECQAEVFRRGERKIRQRQRKIQKCKNWALGIALSCVPIVACLALLSGGPSLHKEERAACSNAVRQELSVTRVEVNGAKGSYSMTDHGEILQLMGLMESYSIQNSLADSGTGSTEPESAPEAAPETQGETMDINEDAAEHLGTLFEQANTDRHTAHETDKGYTLTLVMDDGTEIEYFLLENMLTDLQTGQVTVLSQQQAEDLRAFLEGKVVTQ